MYSFLAVIGSCIVSLLSLCLALPLPVDTVKSSVKYQAENIISRTQKHKEELKISPKIIVDSPELLPVLPADNSIEGLSSMVETLSVFQNVLHSLPKGHVSQLHTDVSTLQGYLEDRMTSMNCSHRKSPKDKNLENFLKENGRYHITLGHVALDRLQNYLQKLTKNLDQLEKC
ncbi:leptin a [Hoplias malabaricus]|uniref:leptin a n=1 Tax=Hoplias malabaricus TaxID=27720 RepID=UPI003461EA78